MLRVRRFVLSVLEINAWHLEVEKEKYFVLMALSCMVVMDK